MAVTLSSHLAFSPSLFSFFCLSCLISYYFLGRKLSSHSSCFCLFFSSLPRKIKNRKKGLRVYPTSTSPPLPPSGRLALFLLLYTFPIDWLSSLLFLLLSAELVDWVFTPFVVARRISFSIPLNRPVYLTADRQRKNPQTVQGEYRCP